jgi:hypothetical protein
MTISKSQGIAVVIGLSIISSATASEAPPAVSAPNVKLDLTGGALGGGPAAVVGATGTIPVGHSFGFQMDGTIGIADRDERGGVGGHFFYRDPRDLLLGITGMWSRVAGPHDNASSDFRRVGVETEFYSESLSFMPSAGVQNSHGDSTGYATFGVAYYLTDNLSLGGSLAAFSNSRAAQLGFEWQPVEETPLSLIADVGVSNQGPGFVLAGVRYSFGAPSTSIKQRDRYDDPVNIVRFMNTVGTSAFTAKAAHAQAPATIVSGGGGGGGGVC